MASFLGLTCHWITADASTGSLSLKTSLISFHHLKKKHTGHSIAKAIVYLLDCTCVTNKVFIL